MELDGMKADLVGDLDDPLGRFVSKDSDGNRLVGESAS